MFLALRQVQVQNLFSIYCAKEYCVFKTYFFFGPTTDQVERQRGQSEKS